MGTLLTIPCRNGKADKRALELLARESSQTTPAPADPSPVYQLPMKEKEEKDWNKSTTSVATYDSSTTVNTTATAPITPGATLVSLPLEKKIEPSELEDQTSIWAGYQQDILPNKTQGRILRNLRHKVMILYRRMFGVVFLVNFGIFIWYAVRGANSLQLGQVVIGNLFTAILMRQDYVIDAFFVVFTAVPPSWPLFIRRICARVYHIGGLHSGAGVSGVLWLILFTARATQEVIRGHGVSLILVVQSSQY